MQKRPPDQELRRRAEAEVQEKGRAMNLPEQDVRKLCHELEVHQVELELQNEALQDLQRNLQVSEEKYRDLYEFAPIGYYTLDPNGEILEANLAGASLLGRGRARLIGARLQFFLEPEDIDLLARFLDRAGSSDTKEACDVRLKRNGGEPAWVLLEGKSAAEGDMTRIRVAATDITKRKQAEEKLRESEARFKLLTENASDIVVILDLGGRIQYASPSVKQVGGYAPEDLSGRSILELTHPDDLPLVMDALSTAAAHPKERVTLEVRIRHISGDWLYLDIIGVNLQEETAVRGIVVNARDVTGRRKAEEAMRESEARFRLALKNSPVSVAAQDRDLRYVWAYNQRSVRPDRIIGHLDHEIFTAEEAAHFTAIKRRVLEEGIEQREQIWLDRPTGRMYLDISWEPIRDRDGRIIGVASATVDLTTIKLAEETLRESEEKVRAQFAELEAIYASAPIGFCLLGTDTRYLRVNQRFADIDGYSIEEHIGKTVRDLVPDLAEAAEELTRTVVETGAPVLNIEIRGKTPAQPGAMRYWKENWWPLKDDGGRVVAINITAEDITERKRAEKALFENEQKLRAFTEAIPAILWTTDTTYRYTLSVGTGLVALDLGQHEVEGKTMFEVMQTEDPDYPALAATRQALEGKPASYEIDYHGRSYKADILPLRDDTGEIIGTVGATLDITERKRAEEALRESEEKFRVALRSSPTAVFQQDLNLRYTWVHQPHPHFTPESLLGKRDEDVLDPRDAAPITALKQRVLDEQRPLQEDVVIRANGNPFYYTVSAEPLYDANGSLIGLSGASTDITGRKRAEQKLLVAVQEKNLILDNTNVAIAFHDAENNFVWANKTYMDYAGVSMSELKGRKCYACWGLDRMCQHCPVILAIKTGEPQEGEVTPENQPHWPASQGSWLVRAAPVRDSEGKIIGAIEVAHDITKRKRAEIALQRRTDDLVRQSRKVEAARDEANMYLDIMTHDVRNANNVSSMYADLLVELLAGDQWLYARKLHASIDRSSEILMNVATIRRAQQESGRLVPVNLDAIIREEIGSFPGASIRYAGPPVEVLADNLLPTIFTNLIGNSVKFGGPDVEVTIRVEEQDGEVLVSVEDTGPGVPDEVKGRLFHRFERGMARGSGEGLGLYIVRTLVTRYGGEVWVEDRVPGHPEEGATFKFTLRVADSSRTKGTGSRLERS